MTQSNNPFKFGSVVDEPFFTNRTDELAKIDLVLKSNNHLIMISPRRFGKTSLIRKVVKTIDRNVLMFDLQLVNSIEDFSAQYLRKIYRLYPFERIKQYIKNFRISPSISLNPVNNEVEISFLNPVSDLPLLEDVLNLLEHLSSSDHRTIVIFDEFQELLKLGDGTDKKFRSIIQNHQNINYVFLGSQETMMIEIFEKKKSPFYHFGLLMPLSKIGQEPFLSFLTSGLSSVCDLPETIASEIYAFTEGHPYYTQQLAFTTWNIFKHLPEAEKVVDLAITETIQTHDFDFERLWSTFNFTDKKILISLASPGINLTGVMSKNAIKLPTSTVFSSLKRLGQQGTIVKLQKGYEIDDPFFKLWMIRRREE